MVVFMKVEALTKRNIKLNLGLFLSKIGKLFCLMILQCLFKENSIKIL